RKADLAAPFAGRTLGEALLTPTRIYVKPMLSLMRALPVKGIAHITGGGLVENPPRILADGLVMRLDERSWPQLPVFGKIAASGVSRSEMRRTFNCGLGLVAVVAPGDAERVRAALESAGERAFVVGDIAPGSGPSRVEFA
ncbi:MAG TPA: AIR synthase-related protein, partial [Polyangia bacterium]